VGRSTRSKKRLYIKHQYVGWRQGQSARKLRGEEGKDRFKMKKSLCLRPPKGKDIGG